MIAVACPYRGIWGRLPASNMILAKSYVQRWQIRRLQRQPWGRSIE